MPIEYHIPTKPKFPIRSKYRRVAAPNQIDKLYYFCLGIPLGFALGIAAVVIIANTR